MIITGANTRRFNPWLSANGTTSPTVDSTWRITYHRPTTECPCGWFPLWRRHSKGGAIRTLRRHITSAHPEQSGE